ncbi:hypothetical protein A2U01_0009072, partial [Trifolium medium]|nr:hypothetical protein [Trifolium medium]
GLSSNTVSVRLTLRFEFTTVFFNLRRSIWFALKIPNHLFDSVCSRSLFSAVCITIVFAPKGLIAKMITILATTETAMTI